MTAITYDEGGLHLITGRCIAVDAQFHRDERVVVYAENIEEVMHPQHSFIGYAEIGRVASQNEIKQERELFAKNTDPMPTTLSILPLYNALNETGRQNFVKECIRPDDRTVVSISARVFRAVHESNRHRERQRG